MSARMIRAAEKTGSTLLNGVEPTPLIHFSLVKLVAGERHAYRLHDFETAAVPLSGQCDIDVDGTPFKAVGGRKSVWEGQADSVYAGPGASVTMTALSDCEIAIAGGRWSEPMAPFRVKPEEVDMVDVGSNETKSRRRIFHILGGRQADSVGRLLVSELYADEGCWSGYPPHKHDTDQPGETDHEELYHWRFNPPTGFGAQLWYEDGKEPEAFVTRERYVRFLDGLPPDSDVARPCLLYLHYPRRTHAAASDPEFRGSAPPADGQHPRHRRHAGEVPISRTVPSVRWIREAMKTTTVRL